MASIRETDSVTNRCSSRTNFQTNKRQKTSLQGAIPQFLYCKISDCFAMIHGIDPLSPLPGIFSILLCKRSTDSLNSAAVGGDPQRGLIGNYLDIGLRAHNHKFRLRGIDAGVGFSKKR